MMNGRSTVAAGTTARRGRWRNGRMLLLGGIATLLVLTMVRGIGGRDAGDDVVAYRGERYAGSVVATKAEVARAGAVATSDRLRGRPVFAEQRRPARIVFLLRRDGRYDAYVLARSLG